MAVSEQTWTIGQLAREFDVTPRTIRFYEDKGLIAPMRDGQNRIFSVRDRARLAIALRWRRFGFTLDEIREGLDLYDSRDGGAGQLNVTLNHALERLEGLRRQRGDLDQIIEDLETVCADIRNRLSGRSRDAA